MQVDTNVSEADIGRVRVGQRVTFTVDAYQNITFTGEVRRCAMPRSRCKMSLRMML